MLSESVCPPRQSASRFPDFPLYQIQKTFKYDQFALERNRDLKDKTLRELRELVVAGRFVPWENPIVVYKDWTIKNGQHRFVVCRENDLPIYYIQNGDLPSASDMMRANDVQTKTTVLDCIQIGRKHDNPELLEMEACISLFQDKLPADVIASMMYNFNGSKMGVGQSFKEDRFSLRFKEETIELLTFVDNWEVPNIDNFEKIKWKPSFIRGLTKACKDAIDHDIDLSVFIAKLGSNPSRIHFFGSPKDCANSFKSLWNKNYRKGSKSYLPISK
jgi:hypothetical protein